MSKNAFNSAWPFPAWTLVPRCHHHLPHHLRWFLSFGPCVPAPLTVSETLLLHWYPFCPAPSASSLPVQHTQRLHTTFGVGRLLMPRPVSPLSFRETLLKRVPCTRCLHLLISWSLLHTHMFFLLNLLSLDCRHSYFTPKYLNMLLQERGILLHKHKKMTTLKKKKKLSVDTMQFNI